MRTVLVVGNDTDIGKTWVVATLARYLLQQKKLVQIVKPVQTGITGNAATDPEVVGRALGNHDSLSLHTLACFEAPLAPLTAAQLENKSLLWEDHIESVRALPLSDWRILEGAGGLAVPLDQKGQDWIDYAMALSVDAIVVVIENRLGAIHQARLCDAYMQQRQITTAGFWLNECCPQSKEVLSSNEDHMRSFLHYPLWGLQSYEADLPRWLDPDWENWLQD